MTVVLDGGALPVHVSHIRAVPKASDNDDSPRRGQVLDAGDDRDDDDKPAPTRVGRVSDANSDSSDDEPVLPGGPAGDRADEPDGAVDHGATENAAAEAAARPVREKRLPVWTQDYCLL